MKIKVIVAAHKKYRMPEETCYLPVHVGKKGKASIGYQGDDTGKNISEKNPTYCELTGLYWMWKNLDADYVGLVHYRRYFRSLNRKKLLTEKDKFDKILTEKEMRKLLKKHDIILPGKRHYYIESLYSHYAHTHYAEHLDLTRKIIGKQCPEYLEAFDRVMKQRSGYMFNMFIMSKEKCNEYCEWLFPILEELESKVDVSQYSAFQARLFGRVSELLLNVWILEKGYGYSEVPVINMEKNHYIKRVRTFLAAKFTGKRYSGSF